ncbi:MAG: addiction module toxin, HicA family [Firmicutes bacterium HGW-Firmicutes-8]|nr:MAG: addiction module toxin, HicA family [Firmicutes bacterium HGW-Firmicutes-8]
MKSYSSTEILKILRHPTKQGKVTVPHPKKDLDPKTIRSILKQAELE